jgi:hypothetical protein
MQGLLPQLSHFPVALFVRESTGCNAATERAAGVPRRRHRPGGKLHGPKLMRAEPAWVPHLRASARLLATKTRSYGFV